MTRSVPAQPAHGPSDDAPTALPEPAAPRDSETLEAEADRLIDSGGVNLATYSEALRRKENYLALLKELEYHAKADELISTELATAELFNLSRAFRDAWLNWPARVAALIATELGVDAERLTHVLTEHVHKHVRELGEPDTAFARAEAGEAEAGVAARSYTTATR